MASNPKNIDKAFIDSSVLIAAAISSAGSARDLIMKALRGELKAIISDLVLEETQRNLTNKASKALPALQLFLEVLNPEVVRPSKTLVLKVAKVVEAKDAPIVAGAISSKTRSLIIALSSTRSAFMIKSLAEPAEEMAAAIKTLESMKALSIFFGFDAIFFFYYS